MLLQNDIIGARTRADLRFKIINVHVREMSITTAVALARWHLRGAAQSTKLCRLLAIVFLNQAGCFVHTWNRVSRPAHVYIGASKTTAIPLKISRLAKGFAST